MPRRTRVVKLARRPRALHDDTITSLTELLKECKSGEVTAVVTLAFRPGFACWMIRSRMRAADQVNMIGQLEYLKWLLVNDLEEIPA